MEFLVRISPNPVLGRGVDGKIDRLAGEARQPINFPEHIC